MSPSHGSAKVEWFGDKGRMSRCGHVRRRIVDGRTELAGRQEDKREMKSV